MSRQPWRRRRWWWWLRRREYNITPLSSAIFYRNLSAAVVSAVTRADVVAAVVVKRVSKQLVRLFRVRFPRAFNKFRTTCAREQEH